MRIVLCSFFIPTRFCAYYLRAAKRLEAAGRLEVITIGPTSGSSTAWGEEFQYPAHAIQPDYQIWESSQVPGAMATIFQKKPDLWVDIDGAMFADAPRGTMPCPHAVVATDPHIGGDYWAYKRQREVADFFFNPLREFLQPNDHYLPAAADPCFYKDTTVHEEFDVTVLGAPYPKRVALAEALRKEGVKVHQNSKGYGGIYDDYRREICKAPVAAIWPFRRDLSTRVFEAAACRRLMVLPKTLAPDVRAALGLSATTAPAAFFDDVDVGALDPWKEISPNQDEAVKNAAAVVMSLLDNPLRKNLIASMISSAHVPTWEARLRQIVKTCLGKEI